MRTQIIFCVQIVSEGTSHMHRDKVLRVLEMYNGADQELINHVRTLPETFPKSKFLEDMKELLRKKDHSESNVADVVRLFSMRYEEMERFL